MDTSMVTNVFRDVWFLSIHLPRSSRRRPKMDLWELIPYIPCTYYAPSNGLDKMAPIYHTDFGIPATCRI